jgi:hypothetical protein
LGLTSAWPVDKDLYNQQFVVKAGHYYYFEARFPSNPVLTVDFFVEGGGIDFIVMDKLPFGEFKSNMKSSTYHYDYNDLILYGEISGPNVTVLEKTWTPPDDTPKYFVWFNDDLIHDRTVDVKMTYNEPIMPHVTRTVALAAFFSGLVLLVLGFRQLTLEWSKTWIVLGYVFAVLGGLLGILIGLGLITKKDSLNELHGTERFHGKLMLLIGSIAIVSYILF